MKIIDLFGRSFVLSISGGNVLTSLGGTEKVIISHQKLFNANGIAYIYIYPVQKTIRNYKLYYFWGVICDGKYMGLYSSEELLAALNNRNNRESYLYKIHVHHLRGMELKQLSKILDYYRKTEIYLYLHDYYIICENYTLVASDKHFCGEGLPCKSKCKECTYLNLKNKSKKRREFINGYLARITMITPSDYPKDVVSHSIPEYKDKIKVLYHQKWVGVYKENCKELHGDSIVKIAYCGLPIPIKGWKDWSLLTKEYFHNNDRIEFYHLGKASNISESYYKNIPVGFQDKNVTMTEALRSNEINVALLWSQCPETYSYVYYECLAANCFIITYKDSGNIAKQVQSNHTGIVLNSLDELRDLISNPDKLIHLINDVYKRKNFGPRKLVENEDIVKLSINSKEPIVSYEKKCGTNILKIIIDKIYRLNLRKKWKIDF